jgi:hypothetical protein
MANIRNIILGVLLLGLAFFMFYRPLEIEDNWWHLSVGRWMFAHHSVPHSDPFPAFGEPKHWILTQWLGSALLYGVYDLAGFEGLKWFRLLVFVSALGIFIYYARLRMPFVILAGLILLIECGLAGRVLLRPDIFNYIFIPLFLMVLFQYQNSGERRGLWRLLVLGALWGNIHLGSFVYGHVLIFLFLAANAAQWAVLKTEGKDTGRLARTVTDLSTAFLLYTLTYFISPYGAEAGLYPFKVFFVPDFIHVYRFAGLMEEATPPVYIFSPAGWWVLALAVAAVVAIMRAAKDRLLYVILFCVPFFLFLRGSRASGFFVLAAAYVIAECAAQNRFAEFWNAHRYRKPMEAVLTAALVVVLMAKTAQGWTERIYTNARFVKMTAVGVDPRFPTDAVKFLKTHGMTGVVFAPDNLGGALLWSSYPALRPFVDGRQIHPDLFFRQVEVLTSPSVYWPKLAEEFGLKIVLLDLSVNATSRLAAYLAQDRGWQLVFLKGVDAVFVQRGAFALAGDLNVFQNRLASQSISPQEIQILSRTASLPPQGLNDLFPPKYNEALEETFSLWTMGFRDAAAVKLAEACAVSGDGNVRSVAKNVLKIHLDN